MKDLSVEAAWLTARWTRYLGVLTGALVLTSIVTAYELVTGSTDTHNLASAALAANRAWIAPRTAELASPIENGPPVKWSLTLDNVGREPATGVVYKFNVVGVPYIPATDEVPSLPPNRTCDTLSPRVSDGLVLWPTSMGSPVAVPEDIPATAENQQLVAAALQRKMSILIQGCFAYLTNGGAHTSRVAYFLRDDGKPSVVLNEKGALQSRWRFQQPLGGSNAN